MPGRAGPSIRPETTHGRGGAFTTVAIRAGTGRQRHRGQPPSGRSPLMSYTVIENAFGVMPALGDGPAARIADK